MKSHTDPEPVRREHDSFDRIASNHEHRNGTSTFIITKGDGEFTLPNGKVVPGGGDWENRRQWPTIELGITSARAPSRPTQA